MTNKLNKQKRSQKSKKSTRKTIKSSRRKPIRKSPRKKISRTLRSKKSQRKSSSRTLRSKKSPRKKSRKNSRNKSSRKLKSKVSELSCDVEQGACEKYKRPELNELAEKCKIDPKKYKNKKSLCEAIVEKFKKPESETETGSETGPESGPESETENNTNCYDDLKSKSIPELKKMLDDIGFVKNKPTKKPDIIGYLCSEKKNGGCNIEKEKYCEGDLICDASNPDGICISKELADSRNLSEITYNGKRIIGSKIVLNKLQKFLNNKPVPSEPEDVEPDVVVQEQEVPEEIPTFDKVIEKDDKIPEGEVIEKKNKKKEGTKIITELEDIDEILEKIQENSDDVNISSVQREILKCLGLLAN